MRWSFEAIGTAWSIEIFGQDIAGLPATVAARIEQFDKTYSRFRPDSLVTRWSQAAGRYQMPPDGFTLLTFYKQLYDLSAGRVTPLVGHTLADAGYDASYTLQPRATVRPAPNWDNTLTFDNDWLELTQPALLDFGAAGKGYLVDLLSELLIGQGASWFCIDAGGDIYYHGSEPLTVGLEDPDDASQAIGTVQLCAAICGSAGNRRAWAGYTHIIDPLTTRSPRHLKAVWVTADTTMLADGLSTALYFSEPATLQAHFQFSYALVHTEGSYIMSTDFPGKFFSS